MKEMSRYEIKEKAWDMLGEAIKLDDDAFNATAIYFKIDNEHNLAVWCDIVFEENDERYFLVSVRYNPEDEVFGDDIGAEWCSQDISKESLFEAIDEVLNLYHKEVK